MTRGDERGVRGAAHREDRAVRLWFHPGVGVAGDMVLASLLDLGADETFVREQLGRLGVDGWTLAVSGTTRRGIVATSIRVDADEQDHHRPWSHIDSMLAGSGLDIAVAEGARGTFAALARAEATVHGVEVDQVHFHEVGALDAIVDIVGSWAALVSLRVGQAGLTVSSGPVGLGTGTVQMAHGRMPVPAPAVLELLAGSPAVPVDVDGETATPTGVALLVTMVDEWGHVPAGSVSRTGRGAGRRDPATHPNVLTAVLIDPAGPGADTGAERADTVRTRSATVLETNLDDVTGESVAFVIERALESGADDAWATPIVMKKGRPAHLLSILCSSDSADGLADLLAAETGTLGFRRRTVDKFELDRRVEEVDVDGHTVRIKIGPHGVKPEHDDVAAVARSLGRPLRVVAADALDRWRTRH